MNRSQMRGFSKGGKVSIKDRLGVGTKGGGGGGAKGGGLGGVRAKPLKAKVSGKGKLVASRLGLPVKQRVGPGKGIKVGVDARDKIILNRVKKGRVTDARSKIEAKKLNKKINSSEVKSLKITAKLSPAASARYNQPLPSGVRTSAALYNPPAARSSVGNYRTSNPPQAVSHGIFANERGSVGQQSSYGGRSSGMPPGIMAPPLRNHPSPEGQFLTRTVTNFQAGPPSHSNNSRSWVSPKLAPSFSRSGYGPDDMEMDDEPIPRGRLSNTLQSRLDSGQDEQTRYKLVVSNLQPTVTTEDIAELFSDIAPVLSATMTAPGHAEVIYTKKSDCIKAVDAYHNRLLDGSPMRVFLENTSTGLKSAGGASMKLPKSSASVKIAPDISAIHKVLFNPSSGNSTRGLFKSGQ